MLFLIGMEEKSPFTRNRLHAEHTWSHFLIPHGNCVRSIDISTLSIRKQEMLDD